MAVGVPENPIFIGIDPGSFRAGLVILGPELDLPLAEELISIRAQLGNIERCHKISNELGALLENFEFSFGVACIERPFSVNKSAFGTQMKTIGYMQRVLLDFNIDILEPDNMTIKQHAGAVTAHKTSLHAAIYRDYGYSHESADVKDAYAMAHFARCYAFPNYYTAKQRLIVTEMIRKSPSRSYLREPLHG